MHNNSLPVSFGQLAKFDLEQQSPSCRPVKINRHQHEILRYSLFAQLLEKNPKTYQLVLQGVFFGSAVKVVAAEQGLIELFSYTQRKVKVAVAPVEGSAMD